MSALPTYRWQVRLASGVERTVLMWPPATDADMRTLYPECECLEPVCALSCRDCRHCTHPGLASPCCIARDDLPRRYGNHHPGRELPADGGATCGHWQPKTTTTR